MGSVRKRGCGFFMRWRTVGRVAVTALVGLLVPAAIAAIGIARATSEIYVSRDAAAAPVPIEIAPPPYDRSNRRRSWCWDRKGQTSLMCWLPTRFWPTPAASMSTRSPSTPGRCH
jgi:hypothetical protein